VRSRAEPGNEEITGEAVGVQDGDMVWPIRNQILVPFALVLVAGIMLTAVSAAVLAARRSRQATLAQLEQVLSTLGRTRFPYSENVLLTMRGLSGAEFAVLDEDGALRAATFDVPAERRAGLAGSLAAVVSIPGAAPVVAPGTEPPDPTAGDPAAGRDPRFDLRSLAQQPPIEFADTRYLAAAIPGTDDFGRRLRLVVLYPETSWRQAQRDAALPPLAVGVGGLVGMVLVSAWLANRFGRRIRSLQEQVARIAAGEFRETALAGGRDDEIQDLVRSVNRMTDRLRTMQQTIAATERMRTLAQLAGGLAHQLRNAATGARMAVQIHRRRAEAGLEDDESLEVALRQLALMEEHLKGLLSVGRREVRAPVARRVGDLLDDVAALVGPVARHAGVAFETTLVEGDPRPATDPEPAQPDGAAMRVPEPEQTTVAAETLRDRTIGDSEPVRTAVLNLVLNALEAAGSGGRVVLSAAASSEGFVFDVLDDGPGPPPELAERLCEPFVTGKPEGVGLGLALARQVAEEQGGRLDWTRTPDGRTRFRLTLESRRAG
jgi:signal transduction histidine kinase